MFGWLKKQLCAHEYDKIADLKDDEENPRAVTIVRMCRFCGDTFEKTFKSPTTGCDHKWSNLKEQPIKKGNSYYSPVVGTLYTLKCAKCGEITQREVRNR